MGDKVYMLPLPGPKLVQHLVQFASSSASLLSTDSAFNNNRSHSFQSDCSSPLSTRYYSPETAR